MKKNVLFKTLSGIAALTLIAGFTSQAQITLTQSDMPQIGDAFQVVDDNAPTVTPGPAGASQTWNLSALHNDGIDTAAFVVPSSTLYSSDYLSSNLSEVLKSSGFSIYAYFNLNSTELTVQGSVIPGFVISIVNPSGISAVLPATYNNHWGNTYTNVNYYSNFNAGYDSTKEVQHKSVVDTVDGYGEVITPAATYTNVLRIKEITTSITDSTYYRTTSTHTWVFQTITAIKPPSESFGWYAKGIGVPVVTLDLDTVGKKVHSGTYLYKNITGIDPLSNKSTALVYPNPASSYINMVVKSNNANGYIKIIDLAGREIESTSFINGKTQFNTSAYANGMYLYLITDIAGNMLDKGKFTVSH